MRLSSRGVSLFTPLVGLMLFMITVMFIINMQTTSTLRTEEALDISDTQRVGDLISAMRTDGLQSIIAGVRQSYANYFDSLECGKGMYIDEELIGEKKDWEDIENDFIEKDIISEAGIINGISGELSGRLRYVNAQLPYKDYFITLKSGSAGVWYEVMQQTLAADGVDAYKIIDCDSSKDCENGSFYLILDTSAISEETFSKMPAIELERQEETKVEPLLPQGRRIPIYVQFRLFKGLANATETYKKIQANQEDVFGSSYNDGIKFGACELGKCGTVSNPWESQDSWCVDGYPGNVTFFILGSKKANVPNELCTNIPGSYRDFDATQRVGDYSFEVSGKYDAYNPQYAMEEVTKNAICYLAAQAVSEDDGMKPLPNDELEASPTEFVNCGQITSGATYIGDEGDLKYFDVSGGAISMNGLAFAFQDDRIVSFDPYEEIGTNGKYRSKRICAEDCSAFSIVTGLIPSYELDALIESTFGATAGGVIPKGCVQDHLKDTDIEIGERYAYCARPYTLRNTCFAVRDTKTEHSWGSTITDYYFEMHMKPDNYEVNFAEAKITDERAAEAGSISCSALNDGGDCSTEYADVMCVHNMVRNWPGLEYYPPEYEEMCAPPQNGSCTRNASGSDALSKCEDAAAAYADAYKANQDCVKKCFTDYDTCKEGCTDAENPSACLDQCQEIENECKAFCMDTLTTTEEQDKYYDCTYSTDTFIGLGNNWRSDPDEMMETCGGAATIWG